MINGLDLFAGIGGQVEADLTPRRRRIHRRDVLMECVSDLIGRNYVLLMLVVFVSSIIGNRLAYFMCYIIRRLRRSRGK